MTVSVYFGLTESGKSYHVQNHVIPQWKKVVIFDNAHCFNGLILNNPTDKLLEKVFLDFYRDQEFRIVVRPGRLGSPKVLFNKTVELAIALGRSAGVRVEPAKRVQMVTDESDFVCSSQFQSEQLKHLVNKGRDDNVDSHFIARAPMRIHTDIRLNSSKIVTFRLQNARSIPLFTDNFGHELADKIKILPKFWRLEWKDNGETYVFNDKNQIVNNFLGNSKEIKKKKGVLNVFEN